MKGKRSFHIIALAAMGGGLSGGDRIFIEFARHWSQKVPVNLYLWEEGLAMCKREKLSGNNLRIHLVKVGKVSKLGFIFSYFYRVFLGLKLGLSLKVENNDYVYSASEFWMDSLPAFILKIKYPKIIWAAAWYQTAPSPLRGFTEGKRRNVYRFNAFLYWFMQQPIKPLISKFADLVLVNNEKEKKQFPKLLRQNKTVVVKGAVNTRAISLYLKSHKALKVKKYLAVFQGRFHSQKGVVELVEIWKLVTQKIPDAKLAMIGDGPLMDDVKMRIEKLRLTGRVELFGYLHDGSKKYSIFNDSMMVVHPAFYDSGGMAAAEAMAFGIPCVGFNLKSYRYYYPKGMVRVSTGDIKAFSEAILDLAYNQVKYRQIGRSAKQMIEEDWSWDDRAGKLSDYLLNI